MLKKATTKGLFLLGAATLLGGAWVVAAAASGDLFGHHDHDSNGGLTNTISITASGGSGRLSTDLSFNRLLPGAAQTVSVNYRNSGTGDEDVYVIFPNATALSALNTLGHYGAVHLSSTGTGSIGDVFDSTNLSDNHTTCATFSATGCWPLTSQYEIARNIGPTTSGTFSFSFEYASAYNKQAPSGTTGYWNPYPVSGQTTVLATDGSGSGLPYEIVATQPGVVPGETGKIFQVDSFERTVTVANSDGSFHDQLAVGGSRGTVSYVVTAPNAHLAVTSSGAITTVGASAGAALPVGTYTVSGTDSDSDGDTGTWSFTLTVIKGYIIQIPPTFKSVSVANSGGSFADQLNVSGARGTVDYIVTASNPHVNVTPSGLVETVGATVGAPLAVGTYTVSGTDSDAYGDTGTWSYTLDGHQGHHHLQRTGQASDQVRFRSRLRRPPRRERLERVG